jgi:hypothetical protein
MRGKQKSGPNGLLYILFWEGANGGKVEQYRCLVFKKRRSLAFDDWDLLEFDSQDWSVFDSCRSSAVYFKSIPSSMFHAFCFHFVSCLLPVVYFVVEIASMCWCPIITCLFPIMLTLCTWDYTLSITYDISEGTGITTHTICHLCTIIRLYVDLHSLM